MIDSSNRCALSPLWGALPRESSCLPISSFVPRAFWQSASWVPCEIVQPIPRLRRYLPIPGKVGPDCLLSFFFILSRVAFGAARGRLMKARNRELPCESLCRGNIKGRVSQIFCPPLSQGMDPLSCVVTESGIFPFSHDETTDPDGGPGYFPVP